MELNLENEAPKKDLVKDSIASAQLKTLGTSQKQPNQAYRNQR